MTIDRLKILLINAISKFADDGYEKDNVLFNLGMSEEELEELTKNEELLWVSYE